MNSIPSLLTKTITFKRLNSKHVAGYRIYALYQDNKYASGIREEELDYIENPSEPNVGSTSIDYEYNDNYTWELPSDIFIDREHKFKVYVNNSILTTLFYQYNKNNRLLTIDRNLRKLELNDKITVKYFRDMVTKTYVLEENCEIKVAPVFIEGYTYGNHNVII